MGTEFAITSTLVIRVVNRISRLASLSRKYEVSTMLEQCKRIDHGITINKNFKDTPSLLIANVGMSWRFDDNWETNYTRIKTDKEIKKKEKKSKKDKGKKRKDEIELEKTK